MIDTNTGETPLEQMVRLVESEIEQAIQADTNEFGRINPPTLCMTEAIRHIVDYLKATEQKPE